MHLLGECFFTGLYTHKKGTECFVFSLVQYLAYSSSLSINVCWVNDWIANWVAVSILVLPSQGQEQSDWCTVDCVFWFDIWFRDSLSQRYIFPLAHDNLSDLCGNFRIPPSPNTFLVMKKFECVMLPSLIKNKFCQVFEKPKGTSSGNTLIRKILKFLSI